MNCITTHKKIRKIGGDLGKNNIFPLRSYTSTHPLKIRAFSPYEIYVFSTRRLGPPADWKKFTSLLKSDVDYSWSI